MGPPRNGVSQYPAYIINYYKNSKVFLGRYMINLLKTVESTFKNEAKIVMLVDSFAFKKSSKNNMKKKRPMKTEEGATKKKVKEVALKGTCFHYG